MNIDKQIAKAVEILEVVGIVCEDKDKKKYIVKTFRGQISSFGAATTMGSLISAVAFFSNKGGADTDRQKLMQAIYMLITDTTENCDENALLMYVMEERQAENYDESDLKRSVINAAVAIKLAMNAYELRDKKEDQKDDKEGGE